MRLLTGYCQRYSPEEEDPVPGRTNAGKHDLLSTGGLRGHFTYVFILSTYFIASLDFITIFYSISISVICVCMYVCVCVRMHVSSVAKSCPTLLLTHKL